jgi:hypothetical protein
VDLLLLLLLLLLQLHHLNASPLVRLALPFAACCHYPHHHLTHDACGCVSGPKNAARASAADHALLLLWLAFGV